jgi:hypothetical protein
MWRARQRSEDSLEANQKITTDGWRALLRARLGSWIVATS